MSYFKPITDGSNNITISVKHISDYKPFSHEYKRTRSDGYTYNLTVKLDKKNSVDTSVSDRLAPPNNTYNPTVELFPSFSKATSFKPIGDKIESVRVVAKADIKERNLIIKPFFDRVASSFKPALKPIIAACCSIMLILGGLSINKANAVDSVNIDDMDKSFVVYYQGTNLGIIDDKEDIDKIFSDIKKDFEDTYQMSVEINEEVEFEEVYVADEFVTKTDEVKKILNSNVDVKVKAVSLMINGDVFAVIKDKQKAESVLERIKKPYIEGQEGKIDEVYFNENVEIVPVNVKYGEIQAVDDIYNKLIVKVDEDHKYTVEDGDSLWSISKKFGVSIKDISVANGMTDENQVIRPGQELNLSLPKNIINVVTTQTVEYDEKIPYETEYKKDNSMYTSQTKTLEAGEEGQKQVVASVIKVNGIEQEKQILTEEVIKQPKTKIVARGTKKPKYNLPASTGPLCWPAGGRISSPFGMRVHPISGAYKMHSGIDIANGHGAPIYAAQDGVVIRSGYSSGYGNLIIVKHGGGVTTRYAHLSKRKVGNGSKVKKGQLIGYMGSTGAATGPHLHFEVRLNGTPKNPIRYLN